MLSSGLNRSNGGVSEEPSTKTKKDFGTNNTADLTSVVSTSVSDKETESEGVGKRTKDDECFESSDFHDN